MQPPPLNGRDVVEAPALYVRRSIDAGGGGRSRDFTPSRGWAARWRPKR